MVGRQYYANIKILCLFNIQSFSQWTNFDLIKSKKKFHDLGWEKRRIFAALAPHNLRLSVYRCRSVETVKLLHEYRASALRLHEYRVSALRISQGRTVNIWLAGLPECQLEKSYDPRESALSCGNLNKPSYFPKSWSLRRPHACCKYSDVI